MYSVDALLGEGGMGKVYTATGPDGGRVALKLVKDDYARDETFRRRFYREARIAQTVKHPNVVPVLDTGEHEGLPVHGAAVHRGATGRQSLDDKLKRDGHARRADRGRTSAPTSPPGSRRCGGPGWCTATSSRPTSCSTRRGRAYITDFGLAKDTQGSLLTLPGQALGSMDYMAPEQIRGEPVTAATDIYALGCVMYECMCGRPPFAEVQGMRILWAHLQDPPPDPRSVRPDIPERSRRRSWSRSRRTRPSGRRRAGEYARMLADAA